MLQSLHAVECIKAPFYMKNPSVNVFYVVFENENTVVR